MRPHTIAACTAPAVDSLCARYTSRPMAFPTKAGRPWTGAHTPTQAGTHGEHVAASPTRAAAAGGDQEAIVRNAVRESTAGARHEGTTTRQRSCSGKRRAHQKSGERRSTGIARRRGTAAKTQARGLGGTNADAVTDEPQTTAGLTSTRVRDPNKLRGRGSGARCRPGAAESGLFC